MSQMSSLRAGLGLLLCVVAGSVAAAPFGIAQLMQMMAENKPGSATFNEKKYLAVLDKPVESSGELRFLPPNRLEKRTLKPKPEMLVLDGDQLQVERRGKKHVLQLARYPEIAGMVESIRATLAGDRAALERVYRLSLQGGSNAWVLNLVPLDARVAGIVTRIRMEGVRDEVRRMEILLADGDRSVMQIRPGSAP
jgi:outer membrane lipoprotein-sorting protein